MAHDALDRTSKRATLTTGQCRWGRNFNAARFQGQKAENLALASPATDMNPTAVAVFNGRSKA
jgi:hypothetical protein